MTETSRFATPGDKTPRRPVLETVPSELKSTKSLVPQLSVARCAQWSAQSCHFSAATAAQSAVGKAHLKL